MTITPIFLYNLYIFSDSSLNSVVSKTMLSSTVFSRGLCVYKQLNFCIQGHLKNQWSDQAGICSLTINVCDIYCKNDANI